jgi:hypothetical protein
LEDRCESIPEVSGLPILIVSLYEDVKKQVFHGDKTVKNL